MSQKTIVGIALILSLNGLAKNVFAGDATSFCSFVEAPTSSIGQLISQTAFDQLTCKGEHICTDSGRARLHMQTTMASDLAQEDIKSFGLPMGQTRVGVLDSGLNENLRQKKMVGAESIKAAHGNVMPDNLKIDERGHGTFVTSVIAGSDGIGVAPGTPVKVFKVLNKEGSGSKEWIVKSAEAACDQGMKIINLSLGNEWLSVQGKRLRDQAEEAFNRLQEKGCLVVAASGNEGFSRSKEQTAGYVEVGSRARVRNDMSSFSNSAVIMAPGDQVVGVSGGQNSSPRSAACNLPDERAVSGTSFAAPAYSGLAAQVRDILLSSGKFNRSSPEKQMQLIEDVMTASVFDNSINSLRAVWIARIWTQLNEASLKPSRELGDSIDSLKEILVKHPPGLCLKKTSPCEVRSGCRKETACLNENRRHALLCNGTDAETLKRLVKGYQDRGELEAAATWLRRLNELYPNLSSGNQTSFPREAFLKAIQESEKTPEFDIQRWVDYYGVYKEATGHKDDAIENRLKARVRSIINLKTSASWRAARNPGAGQEMLDLILSSEQSGLWTDQDWNEVLTDLLESKDPRDSDVGAGVFYVAVEQKVFTKEKTDRLLTKFIDPTSNKTVASFAAKRFAEGPSSLEDPEKFISNILSRKDLDEEMLGSVLGGVFVDKRFDPDRKIQILSSWANSPKFGDSSAWELAMVVSLQRGGESKSIFTQPQLEKIYGLIRSNPRVSPVVQSFIENALGNKRP